MKYAITFAPEAKEGLAKLKLRERGHWYETISRINAMYRKA